MRFSREAVGLSLKKEKLSLSVYFYFLNKEIEMQSTKARAPPRTRAQRSYMSLLPAEGNGTLVTRTYIVRKISVLAIAACNLHFRSHTRSYNVLRRRRPRRDAGEKRRAGSPQESEGGLKAPSELPPLSSGVPNFDFPDPATLLRGNPMPLVTQVRRNNRAFAKERESVYKTSRNGVARRLLAIEEENAPISHSLGDIAGESERFLAPRRESECLNDRVLVSPTYSSSHVLRHTLCSPLYRIAYWEAWDVCARWVSPSNEVTSDY